MSCRPVLPAKYLWRQLVDKMFISSRRFSTRRVACQFLVSPVNSSWRNCSSRRAVHSSRHFPVSLLVVSPFNSSSRPSTRRVTRQLVVSHFNSPFRRLGKRRHFQLCMRILMKQDKPDYLHLIVKLVVWQISEVNFFQIIFCYSSLDCLARYSKNLPNFRQRKLII